METTYYSPLEGFNYKLKEIERLLASYPEGINGLIDLVYTLGLKITELQKALNVILIFSSKGGDGRIIQLVGAYQRHITSILTKIAEARLVDERTIREEKGVAIQLVLGELDAIKKIIEQIKSDTISIFPIKNDQETSENIKPVPLRGFENAYERLHTLKDSIDRTIRKIINTNSPRAHKFLKGAFRDGEIFEAKVNKNWRLLYYWGRDKEGNKVLVLLDIVKHDVISSSANSSRYSEKELSYK